MGLGGISIWSLVLIAFIVIMLFGTKRIKEAGGDVGSALKSLKDGLAGRDDEPKS